LIHFFLQNRKNKIYFCIALYLKTVITPAAPEPKLKLSFENRLKNFVQIYPIQIWIDWSQKISKCPKKNSKTHKLYVV